MLKTIGLKQEQGNQTHSKLNWI